MHKYAKGWRSSQNKYIDYLRKQERKEKALLVLGVIVFFALYAIAGTSDAYVLTH